VIFIKMIGEDGRCLHVALPVRLTTTLPEMSTKSVIMRATTATRAGCVQRGLDRETQGAAASLLKFTHDPAYSSWTPMGSLQTRSALL